MKVLESVSLSEADIRMLIHQADKGMDVIEEENDEIYKPATPMTKSSKEKAAEESEEAKEGFENATEEGDVETVQVNQSLHVGQGAAIRVLKQGFQKSPEIG